MQPLLLAVKAGRWHVVNYLLGIENPSTKQTLAMRDIEGSLPLHVAISKGYCEITNSLIDALDDAKILATENGVGMTPSEIANLQSQLRNRNKTFGKVNNAACWVAPPRINMPWDGLSLNVHPNRPTIENADTLAAMVQSLDTEGKLDAGDLKKALFGFAERTKKWKRSPKKEETESSGEENRGLGYKIEGTDPTATLLAVRKGLGHSTRRELVHLLDAQMAVKNALDRATVPYESTYNRYSYRRRNDDEHLPEEEEKVARSLMQIWSVDEGAYHAEKA